MTVAQVREACEKNNYIILRHCDGYSFAINTGIARIKKSRTSKRGNKKTNFIGFYPIDFQTYISKKHPFL